MNNDTSPPPFEFQQPPNQQPPPPPRNGRRKRAAKPDPAPRKKRKNRRASARRVVPAIARGVSSRTKTATQSKMAPDMAQAIRILASLAPEDHKSLFAVTDVINELDKPARKRVLTALNGIYA